MSGKEIPSYDYAELDLGEVNLLVTRSASLRILSLKFRGSENIFADLHDEFLEIPGGGKFFFIGGHRLWVAPEVPSLTYSPDHLPVMVKKFSEYTELIQEIDSNTGIKKTIRIQKTDFENVIIVDHSIENAGNKLMKLAPWAITQMQLGGTAILPLHITDEKENLFLPNRSLILWSYTDIYDPRIRIEQDFIFLGTSPLGSAIKIGVPHIQKWIAYFIKNILFIKYSDNFGSDCSLDLGAAGQCYCNEKFIELETLGNLRKIKPGESVRHREVWRLIIPPFSNITCEAISDFVNNDEMADVCRRML